MMFNFHSRRGPLAGICGCVIIATTAVRLASGQSTPSTAFATTPGNTTFSTAATDIQSAINQAAANPSSGARGTGIAYIPAGTYVLPSGGLMTPPGAPVHIVGAGRGLTTLKYTGQSAAIQVGDSADITANVSIENLTIDLSQSPACSSSSAYGIHAYRTLELVLTNIEIVGDLGCASPTGQTAIFLDGNAGCSYPAVCFSARTTILSPVIRGSFSTGIYIFQSIGNNIIGGAVVATPYSTNFGNGLLIETAYGQPSDTNHVVGTDFENWDIGTHLSMGKGGAPNGNGPIIGRWEHNNTDVVVDSGIQFTALDGSIGNLNDQGLHTRWGSNSNGGLQGNKIPSLILETVDQVNLPGSAPDGEAVICVECARNSTCTFSSGAPGVLAVKLNGAWTCDH